MPRYKCLIEFDGTGFSGWQRQENAPSIQQIIEEAIEKFSGEKAVTFTSGRTDSGVHAYGMVIHFDLEQKWDEFKVMGALNYHTRPHKIAILEVNLVGEEFHARFCAKKRYYVYKIVNRRADLALDAGRAWHVPVKLDEKKMQEAAQYMIGKFDFTSFRDAQCQAKSPIKTLDEVRVERDGDMIFVHVSAQSFMHHMVRNIVGTLKIVGAGKWQPERVKEIIAAKDRTKAGPTAPAHGLYFVRVDY